jgi:hypothetical protein
MNKPDRPILKSQIRELVRKVYSLDFTEKLEIDDATDQILKLVKRKIPKTKKTCGCEKSELGYHTKECTLYEYGWNDCSAEFKKRVILNRNE